jgi:YVTN family beta-propeller protein
MKARGVAVALFCIVLAHGTVHAQIVLPPDSSIRAPDSPDADPPVVTVLFDPACETAWAPPAASRGVMVPDLLFTGIAPEGDVPTGIAFTTDGSKIIVAHRDTRNLSVYDAATRDFIMSIDLSGSPGAMALSSDGVHAVTANMWEDTASIVDLTLGLETAVVPIGDQPGQVRITPNGLTAVVGNAGASSLSVIDIATATELRRIAGAQFVASTSLNFEHGTVVTEASGYEIGADNATLVFPDYYNNRIRFFDINAGTFSDVASATNPRGIAITPDGTTAVVTHFLSADQVTVIDVATRSISKTIAIPVDLSGPIAINPGATKAIVAVQNASRVVNLVTNAVSGDLGTLSVNAYAVTADGLYAWMAGFTGSLISFASESVVVQLNNIVTTNVVATSPTAQRAAAAANVFGEDMLVVNTNGASGFIEELAPSGPPPELDRTRTVAVSDDGSTAVAVGILGDSASIIDLDTRTVTGIRSVGDRPAEVEIAPDGSKAVVANLDSSFVSVIGLGTLNVSNIAISRRQSEVEISPDSQHAYVAVVADGDGVWKINLSTLSVVGAKRLTGNMGGVGAVFSQNSGMTLSHDGATLVTCNSFDNNISIIETSTMNEQKRLAVGTFPVRAVFSPDDLTIYVSNRDSDTVSRVSNAGAASVVTGTIATGDQPFDMAITPDGGKLFITDFNVPRVSVVPLPGTTVTSTIPLQYFPIGAHIDAGGDRLFIPTGNYTVTLGPGAKVQMALFGNFYSINTQTATIGSQLMTGQPASALAYRAADPLALIAAPLGDGLVLVGACEGDANGDNVVDNIDLQRILDAWASSVGDANYDATADLNDDGTVDNVDLQELLDHWAEVCR